MLRRGTKVLIFDLYRTVVDMQAGLTEAATPYLKAKGWDGAPHRFVAWQRRGARAPTGNTACCNFIKRLQRSLKYE